MASIGEVRGNYISAADKVSITGSFTEGAAEMASEEAAYGAALVSLGMAIAQFVRVSKACESATQLLNAAAVHQHEAETVYAQSSQGTQDPRRDDILAAFLVNGLKLTEVSNDATAIGDFSHKAEAVLKYLLDEAPNCPVGGSEGILERTKALAESYRPIEQDIRDSAREL